LKRRKNDEDRDINVDIGKEETGVKIRGGGFRGKDKKSKQGNYLQGEN